MKADIHETEQTVPSWLIAALNRSGVAIDETNTDSLLCVAADMDAQGDLRRVHLVADDRWLIVAVSATKTITGFSGSTGIEVPTDRLEIVEKVELSRVSCPRIENQVVGGILIVKIDDTERWLCRFSGSRMQDMHMFVGQLAKKITPPESNEAPTENGLPFSRVAPPAGGPPPGGFPAGGPHPGGPPRGGRQSLNRCPKCGRPYPEHGRQVCPYCMEKKTILMRVLRYFVAYKWRLVLLLFCIALSAVLNSVWPYLNGTVLYDQVLGKKDSIFTEWGWGDGNFAVILLLLVLIMAVTKLLQQVTGVIHGRITARIVPSVVSEIKSTVFSSLQRLSISFFTRSQTGSLMQRVNNDANSIMSFFVDGAPYLLFNLATMIFAVIVMFWMDWRLALVAICLLPPVFFVTSRIRPRLWHAHGKEARTRRSLHSALNDNLTGARVVRAFGQEENESKRFERVNARVKDAEMNLVRYRNQFTILYGIARDIPSLLVWSVGALLLLYFSKGRFTYGMLLSFVGYLSMLQGPMDFFSNVFQWWSESMNAAQRVFEIIDAQPDVVEKPDAKDVRLYGDIEVRHVDFGYEPNKPVLHDISFSVKRGEMLGIVGKSGAGKSTLVNLISRLYDPDSGEILIDGHDLRDLSFASLRGSVAMVSQETYIFIGTIAENIAYAKPDATRDEIIRAAVASSAHDFIVKLPDGYDTVIGSGGRQLSGGERQRLSIARAILADPQILVLDEATASVDTETERAIEQALNKLIKNRTTISIAHRLSTLRGANRLVVLSNGRIVESGTHRELVDLRGEYFKLLQLQSKALAMRGVNE